MRMNLDFQVSDDIDLKFDEVQRTSGTAHNELRNRDLPFQHPIGAITGLEDRLTGLEKSVGEVKDQIANMGPGGQGGESVQVNTRAELPNRGVASTVYIVADENASYRWDEANSKYFCIGRDYEELEIIICGGNA